MAVMSLRLCRYSTMRLLCAGSTRAKHRAVVQACRCRWGGSSSNSRPVRQMTVPSCSSSCSVMIPTLRQIDRAVPLLSPWTENKITCSHSVCKTLFYSANEWTSLPVIMMTLMPACRHIRTALRTSFLGGSNMPTQPTKVRSDWETDELD